MSLIRLSEHFTLAESTKSQTALRLGIDNTPDDAAIDAMTLTAEYILEPVRVNFGIPFSPNSFFRCLDLNRAIGSKDSSQHVTGHAVDFEIPGVSNLVVASWCRDNLDFDQLILEFWDGTPSSGWVHCSYAGLENRGQVLTIGSGGTRVGLPDDDGDA